MRRAVVAVTVAGLMTLVGMSGTVTGAGGERGRAAGPNHGAMAIVGTWTVQVAMASCETGEELGPMFPALNTFLSEGSMLSDPAQNPAVLRTGHGVWAHAGGWEFTNTVVLFRFTNGTYAGTQTVRRDITVSHDSATFTARDIATTAAPDGTVVDTRCAIGRGRRLEP